MGTGSERPGWVRWLDRSGWAVVLLGGLVAYGNCFDGQYVLDDQTAGQSEAELTRPEVRIPALGANRWLGRWSFALGVAAFGFDLTYMHVVNLAIHLLAGVALWAVVARTLRAPRFGDRFAGRAGVLATAIAGLWVVHPLTTAAVTYLVQRYESQMGLFVLVSLWAAVRAASAPADRVWGYGLSVVAAYAATATKEPAVVFPVVLFAYDRLFLAGSWGGAVRYRWAMYLALVAVQVPPVLPVAKNVLSMNLPSLAAPAPGAGGADGTPPAASAGAPPQPDSEPLILSGMDGTFRKEPAFVSAGFRATNLTPWKYLRSQSGVILHYLRLAVVPYPLVLDYGWPVANRWEEIWPPGLAVLALLGLTAWAVARGAAGGFLGVWFFAFLAVTSSVVPIADLAFDHRTYLPLVAVVAAAVLGADGLLGRLAARAGRPAGPLKAGAAAAVGLAFVGLTAARNDDYHDAARIYKQDAEYNPGNVRAWTNLGTELAKCGRLDEAAAAWTTAVRTELGPDTRFSTRGSWFNLFALHQNDPPEKLIPFLREFIAADPENPSRRFLLAHALFVGRDLPGAVAEYRAAIAFATRQGFALKEPMVYGYYAQALFDSGDPEAAVPEYRRALAIDGRRPFIHNQLGQALARLGPDHYAEAEGHYKAAADQDRHLPNAPYNLGVLDLYQRRPAAAVGAFEEALRRDRQFVAARLGLAQALHDAGRPDEARARLRELPPAWPDWKDVVRARAWKMATHPEARARFPAEALRLARGLVLGVGDDDPDALDVLAAAQAESGQYADAERTAARAADRARAAGQADRAAEIEARRMLFAAGRPFHRPR